MTLKTKIKKNIFVEHPKITWMVLGLVFLISVELLIRLVYPNQHKFLENYSPRLSNTHYEFNPSKLYNTADTVIFRTNSHVILSGKIENDTLSNAYFFGGSTTADVIVNEGKRWPDLIEGFNTHNYGKNGKSLTHSYYSLKYLIATGVIKNNSSVFIMHGVNDLGEILRGLNERHKKIFPVDYKDNIISFNPSYRGSSLKGIVGRYILPNSSLLSLLTDLYKGSLAQKEVNVRNKSILNPDEVLEPLLEGSITNKSIFFFSKKEFNEFLTYFKSFQNDREIILDLIANELCKKNDLKLILITQPNAYLKEYKTNNGVFHLPSYLGKYFTREQSRILTDMINEHTIRFSKKNNIKYIDVNHEFLRYNSNELFFDECHYTDKGSALFSNIVNRALLE